MCWQGRALLPLLLRKVDRAGRLDVSDDYVVDIAVQVEAPEEFVAAGLHGKDEHLGLLATGAVTLRDGAVTVPHFREGQEAISSNAARQRTYRERNATLQPVTPRNAAVTPRNATVTLREKERDEDSLPPKGSPSRSPSSPPPGSRPASPPGTPKPNGKKTRKRTKPETLPPMPPPHDWTPEELAERHEHASSLKASLLALKAKTEAAQVELVNDVH